MQRLVISLYTKQQYAGNKAAHIAMDIDPNQQISGAASCFFKNKTNNQDKKNHAKGKKGLTRLPHESIFEILYYNYNQFCNLLNKIKNKLVNKRRLIDLSDQYFSNAVSISNFRGLLAYVSQVDYDVSLVLLCNRLRKNAEDFILLNECMFNEVKACLCFKTEERGAAMA